MPNQLDVCVLVMGFLRMLMNLHEKDGRADHRRVDDATVAGFRRIEPRVRGGNGGV
jgi:hypothetical protein